MFKGIRHSIATTSIKLWCWVLSCLCPVACASLSSKSAKWHRGGKFLKPLALILKNDLS